MKQRITIEQINELTDEQKLKLREWWLPRPGDMFISEYSDTPHLGPIVFCMGEAETFHSARQDNSPYEEEKRNCLPLLTIGQMMDIISVGEMPGANIYDGLWVASCGLWVSRSNELCDSLWDIVKKFFEYY